MRHEGITVFPLFSLPSPKSSSDVAKRSNHSKSGRAKRSQFVASLSCKVTPRNDITCRNEVLLLEWGTRLIFSITNAQMQEGFLSLRWESRREAIRSL